MSIKNVKSGDGDPSFWVDVQPDGQGVEQPDCHRLAISSPSQFYVFRELTSRDLVQLIETLALAIGYTPRVNVFLKVDINPGKPAVRSRTSGRGSRRKARPKK